MGWLFLALAVTGFVAMNFIMKLGSLKGYSSPLLTSALFSFASFYCLLFVLFSRQPLSISREVIFLALAGGTGGAVAYFFFLNALAIGNYALTVSIYTMTFLNPVVFSLIFWKTAITAFIAAGIIFIIFSLILISFAGSTEEARRTGLYSRWIIFLAASFFLTGIPQISQAAAVRLAAINLWFYLLLAFLSGAMVFGLFLSIKKVRFPGGILYFGALAAAGSVTGNFFLMKALSRLSEPVVFPINQATPIMAAVFLSIYYFREKIKSVAYLGIALGIIGTIFLALK